MHKNFIFYKMKVWSLGIEDSKRGWGWPQMMTRQKLFQCWNKNLGTQGHLRLFSLSSDMILLQGLQPASNLGYPCLSLLDTCYHALVLCSLSLVEVEIAFHTLASSPDTLDNMGRRHWLIRSLSSSTEDIHKYYRIKESHHISSFRNIGFNMKISPHVPQSLDNIQNCN